MQERELLLFSGITLLLVLSVLFNDFIASLVKGLIQLFFGGTSIGKTLIVLLLFFIIPLILFFFRKLNERLSFIKPESILVFFIALLFIGFFFNSWTLDFMSNNFHSRGPFASFVDNEKFTGYELSEYSHNHFPKVALYYFFNYLNIHLNPKLDNGFPMSVILPNAQIIALIFQLISILLFFSAIFYLLLKSNDLTLTDFSLFLFSWLGFQVLLLDGGLYSTLILIHIFVFSLFISRNYFSTENLYLKAFIPLISVSLYSFILGYNYIEGLVYGHGWSLTLFFTALLCIAYSLKSFISFKLKTIPLILIAVIFLFLSLPVISSYYSLYAFGFPITKEETLFVYGLPKNVTEQQTVNALNDLFKDVQVKKVGWLALIKVKPFSEKTVFTSNTVKEELISRFNPKTYVVVEKPYLMKRNITVKLYFFNDMPLSIFYPQQEFLDIKVLSVDKNLEEKSITLYLEGLTEPKQQILSILTFLREKGFKGKVMATRI